MPIKIMSDLPSREILERENVFVMDEGRAEHQDIRPIRIGILNLMPLKEETELQLLRSLANTPLQVDVTFLTVSSHESKNTSMSHLNHFYQTMDEIWDENLDGLIITGAPVETMEYEEVDYWKEVCDIMEWSKTHMEKGAETLSASAGLCRCLHGEHIIIEEVRCAGLFFRDQRSGLPFFISHSFYCTNNSAIFSSVTITAIANRAIFSRRLFAYFPMTFFEDVR